MARELKPVYVIRRTLGRSTHPALLRRYQSCSNANINVGDKVSLARPPRWLAHSIPAKLILRACNCHVGTIRPGRINISGVRGIAVGVPQGVLYPPLAPRRRCTVWVIRSPRSLKIAVPSDGCPSQPVRPKHMLKICG